MDTVRVAGIKVPVSVASNLDEFFTVAEETRICVMCLDMIDCGPTIRRIFEYFSWKFPTDWTCQKAARFPTIVCRKCKEELVEAVERCPKCNCRQCFYVYHNLQGQDVTQDDVAALQGYWRYLAKLWWESSSRSEGWCDGCTAPLPRGDGYRIGSNIYCEKCAFRPDPLESLRNDPNYFGRGAVQKARHFISGGGPLISDIERQ